MHNNSKLQTRSVTIMSFKLLKSIVKYQHFANWLMPHELYIRDINMSSNRHSNGLFLISFRCEGSIFINNNSYYKTILTSHISQVSLNHGYLEISDNHVRNIFHSIAGSYIPYLVSMLCLTQPKTLFTQL